MTNYERDTDGDGRMSSGNASGRQTAERVAAGYTRLVSDGGSDAGFFERIVEEIGVGVGVYDETGQFTYVNDAYADIVGGDVDDLVGTPVWTIHPTVDEDQFERYWESFDVGETRQEETVHESPDGTEFPVETHTTAVEADGTRYHVGTVADVTQRVEGWRELERQDERLEEFASVVSHDLRNPLNVAMGRIRLIEEECDSEHLDPVENSLERMEELIDDVLTLAREGSRLTEPEPVSLRETVTSAWSTTETDGATLDADDGLGVVQSSDSRLCELFENLFRNAVEHGSPNQQRTDGAVEHDESAVTVHVGQFDDGSGFYVEDDGQGIDPEMRDEVFEYGYSGDARSTGFGLAIVEEISQAHDWTVKLTESASGGARFEFHDVEIE